jgi:hypothetical protein
MTAAGTVAKEEGMTKKAGSRTAGTNTLITAASLAVTLGGWAVLTAREAQPVAPTPIVVPAPVEVSLPALAPLPTVVPPPAGDVAPPAPAVEVAEPAEPVPAQPEVSSRPPRPVTVTRSSR